MSVLRPRRSLRRPASMVELLEDRRLLSAAVDGLTLSPPSTPVRGVAGVSLGAKPVALAASANAGILAPQLSVVVNWGDGSKSQDVPTGSFVVDPTNANSIVLPAEYTYAKVGAYHVSISVSNAGQSVGTVHETIRVAASSPTERTIRVTAGQYFLAKLGTLPAGANSAPSLDIDWGDQTEATFLPTDPAPTVVRANHIYSAAGTYRVTVLGFDGLDDQAFISDRVIVGAAPASKTGSLFQDVRLVLPKQAAVGEAVSPDVEDLTNVPAGANAISIDINWGDGTPAQSSQDALIVGAAGGTASHTYTKPGHYIVTGTFSDGNVSGGPIAKQGITVTRASAAATQLTAVAGTQFQGTLGTISMSPAPTLVTIEWGDGTHSYGNLTALGHNQYQVTGSHTYSTPGTYSVQLVGTAGYDPFSLPLQPAGIAIATPLGFTSTIVKTMTVTGTATPAVAPIVQITPATVPNVNGNADFTATLATMSGYPTDPNSAAQVYASISWDTGVFVSDNNPNVPVQVVNGNYVVSGTHNYEIYGPQAAMHNVTVTFFLNNLDQGQATVLGSTPITITTLPGNTPGGVTLNLMKGVNFSGSVGVATNFGGDESLPPTSIEWGDGSSTSNAITPVLQSDGSYLVTASHTYAAAGAYRIMVENVSSLGINVLIDSVANVSG